MTEPAAAAAADGIAELSQFISFAIGDDQYGVDIMAVREIKGWSQITQLPRQPDYMRGVLNLRGIMVPIGARHVGLLADRVLDIVGINATKIQPVPRIAQGSRADFLSGLVTIESGMIALIDLSRILSVSSGDGGEIKAGGQQGAAQPQGDDHDREQARAEAIN
jgi:purine-binding chemotaxis protein CheW